MFRIHFPSSGQQTGARQAPEVHEQIRQLPQLPDTVSQGDRHTQRQELSKDQARSVAFRSPYKKSPLLPNYLLTTGQFEWSKKDKQLKDVKKVWVEKLIDDHGPRAGTKTYFSWLDKYLARNNAIITPYTANLSCLASEMLDRKDSPRIEKSDLKPIRDAGWTYFNDDDFCGARIHFISESAKLLETKGSELQQLVQKSKIAYLNHLIGQMNCVVPDVPNPTLQHDLSSQKSIETTVIAAVYGVSPSSLVNVNPNCNTTIHGVDASQYKCGFVEDNFSLSASMTYYFENVEEAGEQFKQAYADYTKSPGLFLIETLMQYSEKTNLPSLYAGDSKQQICKLDGRTVVYKIAETCYCLTDQGQHATLLTANDVLRAYENGQPIQEVMWETAIKNGSLDDLNRLRPLTGQSKKLMVLIGKRENMLQPPVSHKALKTDYRPSPRSPLHGFKQEQMSGLSAKASGVSDSVTVPTSGAKPRTAGTGWKRHFEGSPGQPDSPLEPGSPRIKALRSDRAMVSGKPMLPSQKDFNERPASNTAAGKDPLRAEFDAEVSGVTNRLRLAGSMETLGDNVPVDSRSYVGLARSFSTDEAINKSKIISGEFLVWLDGMSLQSPEMSEPVSENKLGSPNPYRSAPGSCDSLNSVFSTRSLREPLSNSPPTGSPMSAIGSPQSLRSPGESHVPATQMSMEPPHIVRPHEQPVKNTRTNMRQRVMQFKEDNEGQPLVTEMRRAKNRALMKKITDSLEALDKEFNQYRNNLLGNVGAREVTIHLGTTDYEPDDLIQTAESAGLQLERCPNKSDGVKFKREPIAAPQAVSMRGQRQFQALNTIALILANSAVKSGVDTIEVQCALVTKNPDKHRLFISSNAPKGQDWMVQNLQSSVSSHVKKCTDKLDAKRTSISSSSDLAAAMKFLWRGEQKEQRMCTEQPHTKREKLDMQLEGVVYDLFEKCDLTIVRNSGERHAEQNLVKAIAEQNIEPDLVTIAGTKIPCGGCALELGSYVEHNSNKLHGVFYAKQTSDRNATEFLNTMVGNHWRKALVPRSNSIVAAKR